MQRKYLSFICQIYILVKRIKALPCGSRCKPARSLIGFPKHFGVFWRSSTAKSSNVLHKHCNYCCMIGGCSVAACELTALAMIAFSESSQTPNISTMADAIKHLLLIVTDRMTLDAWYTSSTRGS
jgi:hypothetical protein